MSNDETNNGALSNTSNSMNHPHAYHRNLPKHHIDPEDGIPFITKFAQHKAQHILKLAHSIQLAETLFVVVNDEHENDKNDEDYDYNDDGACPDTMVSIMRKCIRLQSQIASLTNLKHSGVTQRELCHVILHLLRLVTATVEFKSGTNVKLYFENVGSIVMEKNGSFDQTPTPEDSNNKDELNPAELEVQLSRDFGLPVPAREALLSVLITLLGKKGPLLSVSNAALFLDGKETTLDDDDDRFLLVLHWKVLLRCLLRTAPYLDEHKVGNPPTCSNSRQSTILKRTVHLMRNARHFFHQSSNSNSTDLAACHQIYQMVRDDLLFHTHTHSCYRALIMLYLLLPSNCSEEFYLNVMPEWSQSWSSIDRCPEFDFLWLVLFCRARKHVSPTKYNWNALIKRLLTQCQYWLQIPVGGSSGDKSFPKAPSPRTRSCPSRLKAFVGIGSSYEEGIDFIAKVAKLLVSNIGLTSSSTDNDDNKEEEESSGTSTTTMSTGTQDILRFLSFCAPYFNPSNVGSWTFTLGAFLHYFSYELCHRMGRAASLVALETDHPNVAQALKEAEPNLVFANIPPHELVALLDSLLPLCQQALYSKNANVSRAGEAAMVYLAHMDPVSTTKPILDFATRALDYSSVHLAHQAPAALSAMTRIVQPALRREPAILLSRLPDILRLSLNGIDSNDQNKTIRTLILYRNLVSWVPVGTNAAAAAKEPTQDDNNDEDGTIRLGTNLLQSLKKATDSEEYQTALKALPETSFLYQQDLASSPPENELVMQEASLALSDWSLAFLDRIYALLRASGEREKTGKTASGVASRHSSVDVQQTRNFSRVLKESLIQLFAAMDVDTLQSAIRSSCQFLTEETLPLAAKDASALCQAVAMAQSSSDGNAGMDALVPILAHDLKEHSNKTIVYRLRCLAGVVRNGGRGVFKHRDVIETAIDFALQSTDKHVLKTGCKLLRHLLASQCDSYVFDSMPRTYEHGDIGKSAQLRGDAVPWYVPGGDQIEFALSLLRKHVISRMQGLYGADKVDVVTWRRTLRIIRYALRGCSGILLDREVFEATDKNGLTPHERAVLALLDTVSKDTKESLKNTRGQICSFATSVLSVIASEMAESDAADAALSNGDDGDDSKKSTGKQQQQLYSDTKVCKEISDIALLLLTRRGASFRCQEAKTVWKAQKQLITDYSLASQADCIAAALQRADKFTPNEVKLYKDGEDGGKTIPRRLIVTRLQLFYESLQRNASFEIPRRLRRAAKSTKSECAFSMKTTMAQEMERLTLDPTGSRCSALAGYEGLVNGLFALSCHSSTEVRASGFGVIDYILTRFGWMVQARVPSLLSALRLADEDSGGEQYGIPSCSKLSKQVDDKAKRKRLAEVVKGVCSILSVNRSIKVMHEHEEMRFAFVRTLCGTEKIVSLLPAEDMQKIVYYFHGIFSPFRSKMFPLPRVTEADRQNHEACLQFLIEILLEDEPSGKEGTVNIEDTSTDVADAEMSVKSAHWRNRLLVGWFLITFVDQQDIRGQSPDLTTKLWNTCFQLLENEMGQPIQRVAVGFLGRLVSFALPPDSSLGISMRDCRCSSNVAPRNDEPIDVTVLSAKMKDESFCRTLGKAIVFDHKEDTSIGGGHHAQWSAGVEEILRDASANVSSRTLFPFQRIGRSSMTFKIQHAQLVESILLLVGKDSCETATGNLLDFAKEMAASPPSEDQRNQQCTCAELFGGICRARLLTAKNSEERTKLWESVLIPFLEDVIPKIPISLAGAFFDSVRYGIHFFPPSYFFELTSWVISKIESSIWQPSATEESGGQDQAEAAAAAAGSDGFTAQSKWLYLSFAVLVELDEETDLGCLCRLPWYSQSLSLGADAETYKAAADDVKRSWRLVVEKLLPLMLNALGHPYDSCRDHVAMCLFRICYCHRKMLNKSMAPGRSSPPSEANDTDEQHPGDVVVAKLGQIQDDGDVSFQERYNALITTRKFMAYCLHMGDVKHEYSDFIIPLLPVAFESLKATIEEQPAAENQDDKVEAAKRALEAEVVKGFRYTIADISSSCVVYYGKNEDITRVLSVVQNAAENKYWQVRHAATHFLRCFQGYHRFLYHAEHESMTTKIVTSLLADERREVSSASMAALTGILAATSETTVSKLVDKYVVIAKRSKIKRKKKGAPAEKEIPLSDKERTEKEEKENKRAKNQQTSVFFLCAAVLARPYDTPPHVPVALEAISVHSFERNAPLVVREAVKKCCSDYKKTHMSDNWEVHRKQFSQEQLEALEDVVSSPHYYA